MSSSIKPKNRKNDKYQSIVWNDDHLPSYDFKDIIDDLRGKYVEKTDDFILRLTSLPFIIGGAVGLINTKLTVAPWEFISCLFCVIIGLCLFIITIGFIFFGDNNIYCIGPFKKIYWSINKKTIKKIELAATRDNFLINYHICITDNNKEYIIPLGHRMKTHIEKLSGRSIKDIVHRMEYGSPSINFKNISNILILLLIFLLSLSVILILLIKSGYIK